MTNIKAAKAQQILFFLGFSLLACHELDAVARYEWRLLPGLSLLSDPVGRDVFILLHIPAFVLILFYTLHPSTTISRRSQRLVDLFLIIHACLHFYLSDHVDYHFVPPVETITVYGGAIAGLAHHVWRPAHKPPL